MKPKPYYTEENVTIYHGDCREILPLLHPVDVVLTDPVWPDCERIFPDVDAWEVFSEAAGYFPKLCKRLVVILGCDSDPRFLSAVPASMPFYRVCWMRFIPPRRRGTLLAGADMAYIFGARYRGWRKRVLPGETTARFHPDTPPPEVFPCSRNFYHLEWLVEEYTRPGALVLDPFAGGGSTVIACKKKGRGVIAIEKVESSCALIVDQVQRARFQERATYGKESPFEPKRVGLVPWKKHGKAKSK